VFHLKWSSASGSLLLLNLNARLQQWVHLHHWFLLSEKTTGRKSASLNGVLRPALKE
jgi:hypothetical protein